VRKVDLVFVVFEGNFEGERVVGPATFALDLVLVVADVFAATVPPDSPGLPSIFDRVEQRLLALRTHGVDLAVTRARLERSTT